jgi:hypothetical protein
MRTIRAFLLRLGGTSLFRRSCESFARRVTTGLSVMIIGHRRVVASLCLFDKSAGPMRLIDRSPAFMKSVQEPS